MEGVAAQACRVLLLDPTGYRYQSRRPAQANLESKIKEICQTRVRYGYRRVHVFSGSFFHLSCYPDFSGHLTHVSSRFATGEITVGRYAGRLL